MTTAYSEASVLLAFRAAVLAVLGLDGSAVRFAHQAAPQSAEPVAYIQRVTNTDRGHPYTDGDAWLQHRRLGLQLTAVGSSLSDPMVSASMLLRSHSPVVDALALVDVGVVDVSGTRNVPRPRAGGWEPVTTFDTTLSYIHRAEAAQRGEAASIRLDMEALGALVTGPSTVYTDHPENAAANAVSLILADIFIGP